MAADYVVINKANWDERAPEVSDDAHVVLAISLDANNTREAYSH
jgi:hypothetical protein